MNNELNTRHSSHDAAHSCVKESDLCDSAISNLTEQWKKGELKEGLYWIRYSIADIEDVAIMEYIPPHNGFAYEEKEFIKEVLASVPSYDEWKASYNCMAENEVLRLKNAQLEELLKKCKEWFDWYHIDVGTGKEYIESWHKIGHEIHKKINEVLK